MCVKHSQEEGTLVDMAVKNKREDWCSGGRNIGQSREFRKRFILSAVLLAYCRRKNWAYHSYVIWLRRVNVIQTANFVLSPDILSRNDRYLWSQEHATLYLLYPCAQVRRARQKCNCFWNLCAKLKGERGESWTEGWMMMNFLAEQSYWVRAKIHEASVLPWEVAKSDAEGKRTRQVWCDYYLPGSYPPFLLRQS